MPAPFRPYRERNALASSIAPDFGSAAHYRHHERDETAASAAALHAVRRALPAGWVVEWTMTGGGCSGWTVRDARTTTDADPWPYLLLTGVEACEASADLREGAVVGPYNDPDDDGCDLGTGMFRGEVVEAGDPLAIARAVARQVALIAPPEPSDAVRYAVCVDGAPVEDYPTGEEAVVRAKEIRREGYQGSGDPEAYEPDVVTVLVWVEEEA